jgi:hypothetical protein
MCAGQLLDIAWDLSGRKNKDIHETEGGWIYFGGYGAWGEKKCCHPDGVTAFSSRGLSFLLFGKAFFAGFFQAFGDAFLVDVPDRFGGHFQGDPLVLFGNVEFLGLQVGQEPPQGFMIGVGNLVSFDRSFAS